MTAVGSRAAKAPTARRLWAGFRDREESPDLQGLSRSFASTFAIWSTPFHCAMLATPRRVSELWFTPANALFSRRTVVLKPLTPNPSFDTVQV